MGITTAGYSLPWDLCMVMAYASSSSSNCLKLYSTIRPSSNSTSRVSEKAFTWRMTPISPLKTPSPLSTGIP